MVRVEVVATRARHREPGLLPVFLTWWLNGNRESMGRSPLD